MSYLSLFSGAHGFVTTDQRVYSRDELNALTRVVEQAEQLDKQLSLQSEEQAEALRLARERGHAQGLEEGLKQAEQESQNNLTQHMLQLQQQHDREVQSVRASCADLAVDIVRKIAGTVEPSQWLTAQAEMAAAEMIDQAPLVLRVHEDQVEAVSARLANSVATPISRVLSDENLPPSGCVLETAAGRVSVDLDTQLANIVRLLSDEQQAHG